MTDRTGATADTRPFPPGEYPIVIVGSGPGALQVSYFLGRLGIDHAVISADPGPGGMFRKWPFFQRLLSWTKPYAPPERTSREFERWDWNSLLAREPELRGLSPEYMDGSSDFPSRPEMEAGKTPTTPTVATTPDADAPTIDPQAPPPPLPAKLPNPAAKGDQLSLFG